MGAMTGTSAGLAWGLLWRALIALDRCTYDDGVPEGFAFGGEGKQEGRHEWQPSFCRCNRAVDAQETDTPSGLEDTTERYMRRIYCPGLVLVDFFYSGGLPKDGCRKNGVRVHLRELGRDMTSSSVARPRPPGPLCLSTTLALHATGWERERCMTDRRSREKLSTFLLCLSTS
ncbi:uncharacterized protein IWZ02DRAFT_451165 [Phyllosticta citriasiana]|uniref:uncharacterized protein n=1 Tax=Phyllosticta citriasiana TaxID=595635 RepID=UPI0030FD3A41